MVLLSTQDRLRTMATWARNQVENIAISKADLLAAVNATDQWIEDNSASYNTALPVAARNNLTATQKTLLFVYVAMRRRGILRAEED